MTLGKDIFWLNEKDVQELLSMPEALAAVESAFAHYSRGDVQLPAKVYLDFQPFGGDLRAMPAYLMSEPPAAGVKIVNSNGENPKKNLPAVTGIMVLVDPPTGLPIAVMAAGELTALRTGAAGGVAAKYLARKESNRVGLIGCGRQAATQLAALAENFEIKEALVWGPTRAETDQFIEKTKSQFSFPLTVQLDLGKACDADILVTTTPVRTPLVKAEWVKPGTHINAIGADAPGKQELETALLKKARVFVDDRAQAFHAGEVNVALSCGQIKESDIAGMLGDVIIGKTPGRTDPATITIFDSTGLALQDISCAQVVVQKAQKQNKGKVLSFNA